MPRQLKTYVATTGFFELAVAAPTMKAALEIWGAGRDLFQRGYAKETRDPAIVKATMANPGTVLKRAVGERGAFKEHADLPDVSTWEKPLKKPLAPKPPAPKPAAPKPSASAKPEPAKPSAAERAAERKAARLYEAARKKREQDSARAEALERKARERKERAIEKAETELRKAREAHDNRVVAIGKERDEIERRAREEDDRWHKENEALEAKLRHARA
jgi:colicin import membrane protein